MLLNSSSANNNTSMNDSISKEDTEDYHNSSLNATLPETEAEMDVGIFWQSPIKTINQNIEASMLWLISRK